MVEPRYELHGNVIWDNVKTRYVMQGPDMFVFPASTSDWEMEEFITSINEAWDKLKGIL